MVSWSASARDCEQVGMGSRASVGFREGQYELVTVGECTCLP
jgi:hypothetical protein